MTTQALAHPATECLPAPRSEQFHTKSWSYRYVCPVCGAAKRQNANYLGRRRTMACDGLAIRAVNSSTDWENGVRVVTLFGAPSAKGTPAVEGR